MLCIVFELCVVVVLWLLLVVYYVVFGVIMIIMRMLRIRIIHIFRNINCSLYYFDNSYVSCY